MNGTYSEKLPSGGDLIVTSISWKIHYLFPGPDRRYNYTFFEIDGCNVDKYIEAWRKIFEKYIQLKKSMHVKGELAVPGSMGMTIRIGGYFDGVCLKNYNKHINTKEELSRIEMK